MSTLTARTQPSPLLTMRAQARYDSHQLNDLHRPSPVTYLYLPNAGAPLILPILSTLPIPSAHSTKLHIRRLLPLMAFIYPIQNHRFTSPTYLL